MRHSRPDYCGRHKVDFYGYGRCPACVTSALDKLERVKKAWRAINKWIVVDKMPKEHPLQQLKRALRTRSSQK